MLTDGDGNPATGPEPTVVVVGNAQQLSIVKQVAVVGGGPAIAGATLEYVVRVTNIASVPAQYVVITDDLSVPMPGYLTYVDQSATLNGATDRHRRCGLGDHRGLLDGVRRIAARAVGVAALPRGHQSQSADRHADHEHRRRHLERSAADRARERRDRCRRHGRRRRAERHRLARRQFQSGLWRAPNACSTGWSVELYRNDRLVHSTTTDANGTYRISGIAPNYITRRSLRAALHRAGRGRQHGEARPSAFGVHERSAADHGHRDQPGSNYAEREPADRAERRRLQHDHACADRWRRAHDAECRKSDAAARELLLRSGAAEPGHACRTATTGSI